MRAPLRPRFFKTPADFRRWLKANHRKETELWAGFHRIGSGKPSITWPESVDEALCFGWIDGLRKSIDSDSYMIRFTPRRPGSTWSAINLRKAKELISGGRMHSSGKKVYEGRDPKKTNLYSFEQRDAAKLRPSEEKRFRKNARAWKFFAAQPPGRKRTALWWVTSAKLEETRARRLGYLIEKSAEGIPVGVLRPADSAK